MNEKRIEFSRWSRKLFHDNHRFYLTIRSRPLVTRPRLETMIAEFFNRINKKILGRNYHKKRLRNRKCQGIAFFEKLPDLHCHVVLKPAVSNHELMNQDIIDLCHLYWTGRKEDGTENERDLLNAINPEGDIKVQVLHSPDDLYREQTIYLAPGEEIVERHGVVWYSLKFASFKPKKYDDFVFLDRLVNHEYPSLNETSNEKYQNRRLREVVVTN